LLQYPGASQYELGPVRSPSLLEALGLVQREHPEAWQHLSSVTFRPSRDESAGDFTGARNQGRIYIDPAQAAQMFGEGVTPATADALRHELAHSLGYQDNYEEQPILLENGRRVYGRRSLTGDPRDAQDVDAASHLLHASRR